MAGKLSEIEAVITTRRGKENAVSNLTLQRITGSTRREVSAMIHALRQKGLIIVSDKGYYIPVSNDELISGYNILWKRSVSMLSALKTMRAEIRKRGLLSETAEAKSRKARKKSND